MSFIDENCIVFDSEEENKLSYTDTHKVRFNSNSLSKGVQEAG